MAWYAFIDLLDINFEEGFLCARCGLKPHVVVMDATTLSFRKQMLSWKDVFQCVEESTGKVLKGRNQVVLQRPKCRRLLKKFAKLGMDIKEFDDFLETLIEEELILKDLLMQIQKENCHKSKITCCPEMKNFLRSLSCNTPACCMLDPTEMTSALMENLEGISSDAIRMGQLQTTFPLLFQIFKNHGECYTNSLRPVIKFLLKNVNAPFNTSKPLDDCHLQSNIKKSLAFFPALPLVRNRGVFEADITNVRQPTCRKKTHSHPTLLPGLFTLLCPHGVCYGFEVMTVAESPNVPFTVLRTRFSNAPELVIYDNACNLHRYCLNRDPHFFKYTRMKVDGLHWDNHQGCSDSYELKSFPQYRELNSQVVEQFNSQIKKLKGSISYMTKDNFFKHLKLFVWAKNNNVLNK